MFKSRVFLFSVPLLAVTLAASNIEKANIEVTAKHVEGDKSTLYAQDGVVVYYQNSIKRADIPYGN